MMDISDIDRFGFDPECRERMGTFWARVSWLLESGFAPEAAALDIASKINPPVVFGRALAARPKRDILYFLRVHIEMEAVAEFYASLPEGGLENLCARVEEIRAERKASCQ